jgi:hypothetical protein
MFFFYFSMGYDWCVPRACGAEPLVGAPQAAVVNSD